MTEEFLACDAGHKHSQGYKMLTMAQAQTAWSLARLCEADTLADCQGRSLRLSLVVASPSLHQNDLGVIEVAR